MLTFNSYVLFLVPFKNIFTYLENILEQKTTLHEKGDMILGDYHLIIALFSKSRSAKHFCQLPH